jgi:hypothetical protein
MGLMTTLKALFSAGGKATAIYQRGMEKAKKRDFAGAIADYTAVIDANHSPADIKAMSHFNRALAYSAEGDHHQAHKDLEVVMAMDAAPHHIKSAAKEKLARWDKRQAR